MKRTNRCRALDFMVHTRLYFSQVILQIFMGTLVPDRATGADADREAFRRRAQGDVRRRPAR